ncbi:sensor histidine kinase [Emticicia sp. BO119]|uniref:sensor histidine kinase n=1 Tax=Emticicia sp. BO119 TaxID=2757768 RepID=UPI0015F0E9D2|nr:sensor histidine kinase [Emticicia sp. BO119]MBA4850496.1 sensor histidine kinase [Emticicia sp. BO119]
MKNILLHFLLWFQLPFAFAQPQKTEYRIKYNNGVLLVNGWKYHSGDDPNWRKPEFNDSAWKSINPTLYIKDIPEIKPNGVGWLRIRFRTDSSLLNEPMILQIRQSVASELYLNGKFIPHYQQNKSDFQNTSGYDPIGYPISIHFADTKEQVIAIRFRVPAHISPFKYWWRIYALQYLQINRAKVVEDTRIFREIIPFRTGIMFVLFLVHIAFFYFQSTNRANLYFSLYAFSAFLTNTLFQSLMNYINNVEMASFLNLPAILAIPFSHLFLIFALHELFQESRKILFWVAISFILSGLFSYFIKYEWSHDWNMFWSPIIVGIAAIRITWQALKEKKRGAKIVLTGAIIYFISAFCLSPPLFTKTSGIWFHLWYTAETLSLLIALSCYLAYDFALTNQSLRKSISEIELLSEEKQTYLMQENTKLQAALLQGQTTERKRVAADLHDNLGSTMSSLKWAMEAINIKNLLPEEQRVYSNLKEMLESAYNEVRLLSHNLLPEEFEKQGLQEALRSFIRKLNANTKISFSLDIATNVGKLDKKTEFELYTICLELVNNILKHSQATEAKIALTKDTNQLSLQVIDNGVGKFENNSEGKGLKNIEARIKGLSGSWETINHEGWTHSIRIPI